MRGRVFVLFFLLTLSTFTFAPIVAAYGSTAGLSLSGTVTPQGCKIIDGIIVTGAIDSENAQKIELCNYGNKYFKIVYYGGCPEMVGTWTDTESGKTYGFGYACDAPLLFSEGWKIYLLSDERQMFKIPYKITNGQLKYIEVDPEFSNLILRIQSSSNGGNLELTLPRELTDQQLSIEDDLIVIVDEQEVKPENIMASPCFSTLLIPFYAGSEEIEVLYSNAFYGENFQGAKPSGTPYVAYPVYVTTDKSNYEVGETIIISGCTSLALDDKIVVGEVVGPEGRLYSSMGIEPRIDGSFSSAVGLEHLDAINGTYTATVKYAGQSATTAFVVPEFPVSIMIASLAIGLMLGMIRLKNIRLC